MAPQTGKTDPLDLLVLEKILSWRLAQAGPEDLPAGDVDERLRHAGEAFRGRVRPFTSEEIAGALKRMQAVGTD